MTEMNYLIVTDCFVLWNINNWFLKNVCKSRGVLFFACCVFAKNLKG